MICPHCGSATIESFATESKVRQCYDYREYVDIYYYKCSDCEQYSDRRIATTGVRRLTSGMAKRAQKLVDLKHN